MSGKLNVNPEQHKAWQETGLDWEDLAAGGYSALDSALFGIPTLLVKTASKDAYQKLKELKERNIVASSIGDIGGAFIPTGGLLAKGVGKGLGLGAKAFKAGSKGAQILGKGAQLADTASDIIRTGGALKDAKGLKGIGAAALRGGLTAAEQVPARLLSGEQTLPEALGGIALGGGLGAGFKALGKVLPARKLGVSPEKFAETLEDTALSGRGIKTAHMRKALNASAKNLGILGSGKVGYGIKEADRMKTATLDMMKKFGLETEDDVAKFLSGEGDKWDEAYEVLKKSGIKVNDIAKSVVDSPEVAEMITVYGDEAKKAVEDVSALVSKGKDVQSVKKLLQNEIAMANKSGTRVDAYRAEVAKAIRENIDDTIMDLHPELKQLKETWRDVQPLRQFALEEKLKIDAPATSGSPTQAKQMVAGAVLGAGGSGAAQEFDPTDPSTWGSAAGKVLAGATLGSVGGAMLTKASGGMAQGLLGKTAEGIQAGAKVLGPLSAKIASVLGRIGLKEQVGVTTVAGKMAGKIGKGAVDEETISESVGAEAAAPDDIREEATTETNEKYTNVLRSIMQNDYAQYFADQMSYEEFEAEVGKLTDGFNPIKTAAIIFKDPDQRSKYLKDYNVAMKLKGVDVGEIAKQPNALESLLNPSSAAEQKKAYMDVVDAISSLTTGEDKLPSAATIKKVQADIKAIADLPASPEEKKQLLFDKLSDTYGLDINTLSQLGVV